jgi:hypothetical protein
MKYSHLFLVSALFLVNTHVKTSNFLGQHIDPATGVTKEFIKLKAGDQFHIQQECPLGDNWVCSYDNGQSSPIKVTRSYEPSRTGGPGRLYLTIEVRSTLTKSRTASLSLANGILKKVYVFYVKPHEKKIVFSREPSHNF